MGWQPETHPKGKPPVEKPKGAEKMKRLIDVDAAISGVKNRCIGQNDVVKVEHSIISMLYMMPTIDAIPIEWIICKRNEHNNDGFAWIFDAVLDVWRREHGEIY